MVTMTRKEAIAAGATRYFNGKPCARGHVAERHTSNSTCVECTAERVKAWDAKNPGRKAARTIASQKRTPEKVKARRRRHYAENRERISQRFREWYAANKEHMLMLNRRWNRENWVRRYAKQAARTAKARCATPPWLTREDMIAIEAFYEEARRLTKETGVKYHVDHIVPLNGEFVSGLHVPGNLRVITASENSRKKNQIIPELLAEKGYSYG